MRKAYWITVAIWAFIEVVITIVVMSIAMTKLGNKLEFIILTGLLTSILTPIVIYGYMSAVYTGISRVYNKMGCRYGIPLGVIGSMAAMGIINVIGTMSQHISGGCYIFTGFGVIIAIIYAIRMRKKA